MLKRCRTLLGAVQPEPPAPKTTAEWILQILGIDVNCCPQCGKKTLQRTEVPPVRPSCFKAKPVVKDTS